MDDEQILAQAQRMEFRRKLGLGAMLVGALSAAAGATEWIPTAPTDKYLWMICAAVAAVMIAAGLALRLASRIPPEARSGRLALMRAERSQGKRQVAFLLMPLSLGLMLVGVVQATSQIVSGGPVEHTEIFVVVCFIAFLLAFALLIAGRGLDRWAAPVLDDELSRELRSKALQLGYAILLPGLVGLFVVGLFDRNLAIELAPVLAALGVGGPALRLLWLERAAGAGAIEA